MSPVDQLLLLCEFLQSFSISNSAAMKILVYIMYIVYTQMYQTFHFNGIYFQKTLGSMNIHILNLNKYFRLHSKSPHKYSRYSLWSERIPPSNTMPEAGVMILFQSERYSFICCLLIILLSRDWEN